MTRLGVAAGANPMTFAGLAGIGDVMATCASPLSRKHRLGVELAGGRCLIDLLSRESKDELAGFEALYATQTGSGADR